MPKSIKTTIFSIIILASTLSTLYFLNKLDQIVHGELYSYGLLFSLEWADPYWNMLRIIQALLAVASATAAANLILAIRRDILFKEPTEKAAVTQRPQRAILQAAPMPRTPNKPTTNPLSQRAIDWGNLPAMKPPSPPTQPSATTTNVQLPTVAAPAQRQFSAEISGPMKCHRCDKAFTQPLRMLDYQGERPRIVNICPFCNEIIQTEPKQESKDDRFSSRTKNNHASKTSPSQPLS